MDVILERIQILFCHDPTFIANSALVVEKIAYICKVRTAKNLQQNKINEIEPFDLSEANGQDWFHSD